MENEVRSVCIFPKTRIGNVQLHLKTASDQLVALCGDLNAVLVQLEQIGKGTTKEYDYANYLYNGIGNALDLLGKTQLIVDACYTRRGVRLEFLAGLSYKESSEQEDSVDE